MGWRARYPHRSTLKMSHHEATSPTITGTAQRDKVIWFAQMLYGEAWRDGLSEALSMKPSELNQQLESSAPLSLDVMEKICAMMEDFASEQDAEICRLQEKTALLEKGVNAEPSEITRGRSAANIRPMAAGEYSHARRCSPRSRRELRKAH